MVASSATAARLELELKQFLHTHDTGSTNSDPVALRFDELGVWSIGLFLKYKSSEEVFEDLKVYNDGSGEKSTMKTLKTGV